MVPARLTRAYPPRPSAAHTTAVATGEARPLCATATAGLGHLLAVEAVTTVWAGSETRLPRKGGIPVDTSRCA